MPQEDVFELTASVTVEMASSEQEFVFAPTTFEPHEEPQEAEKEAESYLPLDAAQYPWIDFSIPPSQRNDHTDAEIWTAWYEGMVASPELSPYSPEVLEYVYQSGLDWMS